MLLHCGFPAVGSIGSRIDHLRSLRIGADYDLQNSVAQTSALDCVQRARAVLADFQALLPTTPAAQIVAGARQHLQMIGKIAKTP